MELTMKQKLKCLMIAIVAFGAAFKASMAQEIIDK
jgi:hypothetical protein